MISKRSPASVMKSRKCSSDIDGQADVSTDQISGQPGLRIELQPEKMARLGVSSSEILPYIEAIGVLRVGEIYEGQRQFPLAIVLPDKYRTQCRRGSEPGHSHLPPALASRFPRSPISSKPPAATINREWGRRLIRVQSNVDGRDVGLLS